MEVEDKYTVAIAKREITGFLPFVSRMWKYTLANGLHKADAAQLRRDYGTSFFYAQLAGGAAVFYWNIKAMDMGMQNKWLRVKWTLSSYIIGGLCSIPWSVYLKWSPMSRAFVSQTMSVSISEWRNPSGLIVHDLLPNSPADLPNASTTH